MTYRKKKNTRRRDIRRYDDDEDVGWDKQMAGLTDRRTDGRINGCLVLAWLQGTTDSWFAYTDG